MSSRENRHAEPSYTRGIVRSKFQAQTGYDPFEVFRGTYSKLWIWTAEIRGPDF